MKKIWGKRVLLPDGWSANTLIVINEKGKIKEIKKNVRPSHNTFDTLIPSPMNLHSHCFQRAMSGLSEKSETKKNDFWSWRNFMYKFLNQINPDYFESICAFAQMEMLEAGYAGVTEFHYIHNDLSGAPYNTLSEMSQRIVNASYQSGIGLTLLPVLYEQGGVFGENLISGQKRFGLNLEEFFKLVDELHSLLQKENDTSIGVAAHSLRAVKKQSLLELSRKFTNYPMHIHLAEQNKEVTEILNAWNKRPIEWLVDNLELNPKWCLIHCTQMLNQEAKLLAETGVVIGLCPITEANLGDGIFNGFQYNEQKGLYGIGTDSNINISLTEELKTFEYSQRLLNKKRAVISNQKKSTGRKLFDDCLEGGARALQINNGKIQKGFNADLISLPNTNNELDGLEDDKILDYWIFASRENDVQKLWNKGKCLVENGKHFNFDDIQSNYRKTIKNLQEKL